MSAVWLTYAWDDNKEGDVDFVIQELRNYGVNVKSDRWNLNAGEHLWTQIERFIQNPNESAAWLIYLSQNSLASKPCREEYVMALDRALDKRTDRFPIIGISNGLIAHDLLPAAIKTRLYVSLADTDWKERIKASLENRNPEIKSAPIEPYHLNVHNESGEYFIEVRPRVGSWSPFVVIIPYNEKDIVSPELMFGPKGKIPMSSSLSGYQAGPSNDQKWYRLIAGNEATNTQSYYVYCKALPSTLIFGAESGPTYTASFSK